MDISIARLMPSESCIRRRCICLRLQKSPFSRSEVQSQISNLPRLPQAPHRHIVLEPALCFFRLCLYAIQDRLGFCRIGANRVHDYTFGAELVGHELCQMDKPHLRETVQRSLGKSVRE